MDIGDFVSIGIPSRIADAFLKLRQFQPRHWKGNLPPEARHFDSIDHFGFGANGAGRSLFIQFGYTDTGTKHILRAEAPTLEFGKRGAHCTVTVDGVEEPGQMVVSFRSGFENGFYERAVFEFYYGPEDGTHIRFDGDLA